ncbi:hypothetical protein DVH24_031991 [Malus domestica]|uniref:Uncharacterized protein n=1 Tax=Malus domestica TaxID=3750 RepID=A0A498J5X1_MALDO|nr:hypothetical protein DVH24_031991 [Malus domestica]
MAAIAVSSPKSPIFQNPISLREPSSSLFGGSLKGFCFQVKPRSKSRKAINLVVAATNSTISGSRGGGDRFYINFTEFPFPLGPFLNRSLELRNSDCMFDTPRSPCHPDMRMDMCWPTSKGDENHRNMHAYMFLAYACMGGTKAMGAKTLKDEDFSTSRADEIEQKVLSSPEVDAVIFVPRQPPDCISKESLLASAVNGLAVKLISKGKEVSQEPVVDNKLNRQKGWERMVLQILFLSPSNLLEPNASFAQMSQKLIVSPIVSDWVDGIAKDWSFRRTIPAHFAAPINASRSDLLAAFAFLDDLLDERYVTRPSLSLLFTSLLGKAASYFPPDDMQTLSSLGQFLVSIGAVKKTVCLGYKGSLAKRKDPRAIT